ncbi:auxin response factor 23-like [Carya illinoinensis]|uniref:auxin response factor 23-like n=1 Tax=Carya illinoinensis TaxID=32201 RepID=UPI001C71F68E|nr:auxin response factor 23-like [Carya illinoinensis]
MATVAESNSRRRMDGDLPGDQNDQRERDDLHTTLWHACAGPHVYIPRAGEKVFYFPQGHMEQVEAYTYQDGVMEMTIYNLPSKILCKVVYVHLKAEAHTDEVFAQVTLIPEAKQDKPILGDENDVSLPQRTSVCSYVKKLTASDTSTHGGFSAPRRQALECFPPLDMSQQPSAQELITKYLHGFEWCFRHICRGQPKRHLLTSGWSIFVTAKKLVADDACIFIRGENGKLCVGIRRAVKPLNNASASVISGCGRQQGILASAFHVVSTGTMFTMFYHPWTSPSDFIIPVNWYMKLTKDVYSVGMRFRMQFEGKGFSEKILSGTVVGVEDIDCIRWPSSKWRCLKVKWDPPSDKILYPERVSPWNIELIESNNKNPSTIFEQKRRPINLSVAGSSSVTRDCLWSSLSSTLLSNSYWEVSQDSRKVSPYSVGLFQYPVEYTSKRHKRVLQGRFLAALTCGPQYLPTVSDNVSVRRNISVSNITTSNFGSKVFRPTESRDENDVPLAQPIGCARLFGSIYFIVIRISLHHKLPLIVSLQGLVPSFQHMNRMFVKPSRFQSPQRVHLAFYKENNATIFLSLRGIAQRSQIVVLKYGTAHGRSVDLMRFNGYDELVSELDQMLDFKGSLIDGSSRWHVIYIDGGDIMLIGHCPWQEFCLVVQRIFIFPKEEIDKLIQTHQI